MAGANPVQVMPAKRVKVTTLNAASSARLDIT